MDKAPTCPRCASWRVYRVGIRRWACNSCGKRFSVKPLKDSVSLKHEFEQITMTELRSKPGEVMTAVELGKTFLIMKAGKPIAVLSPLPGEQLTLIVHPDGKVTYGKSC